MNWFYIFLWLVYHMSQQPKFNENNVYRVRRTSRLNEGLFLSKLVLKKHGSVQIEGLGETISLVCKLSQILSKNGFATVTSIRELNLEREGRREINPKISILLQKSAQFDALTADLKLKENWDIDDVNHYSNNFDIEIHCQIKIILAEAN